jgi:hypothetical protein
MVSRVAGSASTPRSRVSIRERDRVAARLREACADERLSVETFVARVDSVYAAQSSSELALLVSDLRRPGWPSRLLFDAVAATSRWTAQLAAAWREPRTPRVLLPSQGREVLGRSRACDRVIAGQSVSRRHAVLRYVDGRWFLKDAGSLNGTYVNGVRIGSEVEVRPGDDVALGEVRMILCAPRGDAEGEARRAP